jgi:4-amino-4-deoxy-L-arabinose transferase-like glycosyltransferase
VRVSAPRLSRFGPLAAFAALLGLCLFLFFYRLGERDLWSSHEGRAAQDAVSMVRDGYWAMPRLFDQQYDLQKPPLYYWCVAGLGWLNDGVVDAGIVRLPAALSALATVLFLAGFGGSRRGWIAALLLAIGVHFTWLARTGRIDMPLTLAISVALMAFHRALSVICGPVFQTGQFDEVSSSKEDAARLAGLKNRPTRGMRLAWLTVGYVALAVAVLLKGPIGLVLPGAVLAVHLLVECWLHGFTPLRRAAFSLVWGVPLVLLIVLPWFLWASAHTDGRLMRTFFWYHNIERAFGGEGGLRAHPWWFYAPRLFADLLPWSVLLPFAIVDLCRDGRWREDRLARFGLIWFGVMVLVLSLARFKRADYLLPAYPGAALLVGCHLARQLEAGWLAMPRARRSVATIAALLALGCIGGWAYCVDRALPAAEPARESKSFATEIRRIAPDPQLVIFFRAESHALAFHVGRPINTVLEWENVEIWLNRPGEHYFVMPPECVSEWPEQIRSARLEILATNETPTGPHEHPLVFARSVR